MTSHSNFRDDDNDRAVVAGTVATVGGVGGAGAVDTVTNPDDAMHDTNGEKVSSSYRQDAGIQTQGQQAGAECGRRRRTLVTTAAVSQLPSVDDWIPASCRNDKP